MYFYHNIKNFIPYKESRVKELNKIIFTAKLARRDSEADEDLNIRKKIFKSEENQLDESNSSDSNFYDDSRNSSSKEKNNSKTQDNGIDFGQKDGRSHLSSVCRESDMFISSLVPASNDTFAKRILNLSNDNSRVKYKYFTFTKGKCVSCGKIYSSKDTNKISLVINKKNTDISIIDHLRICDCLKSNLTSEYLQNNFELSLVVKRKVISCNIKDDKTEVVGTYPYYHPFALFEKLCAYLKVAKLNPKKLRSEQEDLFWNLIYRFSSDNVDHNFIIPYAEDSNHV